MKVGNKIIAHRGIFDNQKIPENSLKAFQKAVDKKIPIELDVQLTKDDVLVVFHDDDLLRMTGHDGILQKKTYEEIKNYSLLDTKEKIPMFSKVLDLVDDKVFLDIEVKGTKRIKKTCDVLLKLLEGHSNYVIKSFHPEIIRAIKKKRRDIEVGLLIPKKYDCNFIFNFFLQSRILLKYGKADFIAIHKSLIHKKKYQKLSKKYPIMLWTIKDYKDVDEEDDYIYICNNLTLLEK